MPSTKPNEELANPNDVRGVEVVSHPSPEIRIFRTRESLEELRAKWLTWPGNRDSDWYLNLQILESNPSTETPHVLCVYRNGEPDAILVGRKSSGKMNLRIGYLKLGLSVTQLYFVYGAFRGNVSTENARLLVREILQCLRRGEADLAYMNFHREDSPLFEAIHQVCPLPSRGLFHDVQKHYATSIPGTMDEYYQRLSHNSRSQAKSKVKKLVKQFPKQWRLRCFRNVEELDELVRDGERVAGKSYQRGLGVGFQDTSEERARIKLKAQKGWLRAYILYLGDEPAAIWFGDINEGIFGSDYLAFDPQFAKFSPGICLIVMVIEGFCGNLAEPVRGVDFATGYARYKEMFSDSVLEEKNSYIFAPTLKGTALNVSRFLAGNVNNSLKWLLTRTNLLEIVKRTWRSKMRGEPAEPHG